MEILRSRIAKIFSKIPTIRTERLTLRKLLTSDYKDMYEYARLRQVTEYLLWNPHVNQDQTYRYLESVQASYKRGEFFDWAVVLTESGKMIGTCGYTSIDVENRRVEVGYVMNPDYWGNGYAVEAVMAAEEFAFIELGFNRVEAHFIEGNDKSLNVMRKCGMSFEGILRQYMFIKGRYRNIGICAVTREAFQGRGFYEKEKSRGWLEKLIH